MDQLDQSVEEFHDIARPTCDAETPSVGVLKRPGSPSAITLEFIEMSRSLRQRLRGVLLKIAEDPNESLDRRMEATDQLVEILKFDDMKSRQKDKRKLELLRQGRAERVNTARRRRGPKSTPITPDENALGIST